jgi:hypothetical protein
MRTAAIDSRSTACPNKQALRRAYLNAVCEAKQLLRTQAHTLVKGTAEFDRFELLLALTREKLDKLKLAYAAHMRAHRCGSTNT